MAAEGGVDLYVCGGQGPSERPASLSPPLADRTLGAARTSSLVQLWPEAGPCFRHSCPRRCGSPTSPGRRGWPPGSCRPIDVISKRPHKVRARSRVARGRFYSCSSAKGCAQSSPPASRPIGLLGGAPTVAISGLFSTEVADVLRRRRRGVVRPAWRPDRGPRRWDCEASVREHAREEEQGPAYEQDGAWHHRPDHTTKTRGDGSQMLQSAMLQKPVTNVWCRGVFANTSSMERRALGPAYEWGGAWHHHRKATRHTQGCSHSGAPPRVGDLIRTT